MLGGKVKFFDSICFTENLVSWLIALGGIIRLKQYELSVTIPPIFETSPCIP
jgi:hypothetical protein